MTGPSQIADALLNAEWSNVSIGNKAIIISAADALRVAAKHIDELQAKIHCMCGDTVDHSPWSGHSPVSMFDHAVEQEVQRRLKRGAH